MLIITFDITDDNEILTYDPQDQKILREKVNPDAAYLYRKRLDEEIMIRTYIYSI